VENSPDAGAGPGERPDAPAVRASDADRERVAVALRAAYAEGRLTMPELEERPAAAYAARTGTELARSPATWGPHRRRRPTWRA
jgi:hypothetical protein